MALLAMAAAALCWVPAFLHCELRSMLMLQKNAAIRFPALRIHSEVAVVFLQATQPTNSRTTTDPAARTHGQC